ncbi:MAG: NAD(P)-dependent oxidoreductase [Gemmatimonadota bacterium]|nr:NAD(P)-dependent oxidoreductase [Gemmatimonadota bacterium]
MKAFLGTGLMGSAFVSAMLARGDKVTVWNRTLSRAALLESQGAILAPDPATAVRDASRVHLSLLDDNAVDDVLQKLLPTLAAGAIVVDHSTTAAQSTAARAERLSSQGVRFLHAPVFMGPANARAATGSMLVAGPADAFEETRHELENMTGKVRYMGARPDLAAAYKLFGNMAMMFVVSGVAEVFTLGRALGITPRDAVTVFDDFNPGTQIAARGQRMADGEFTPAAFELSAARKDIRLMLESAAAAGGSLNILPAIADRFDRIIEAGYGQADVAAVAADIN